MPCSSVRVDLSVGARPDIEPRNFSSNCFGMVFLTCRAVEIGVGLAVSVVATC